MERPAGGRDFSSWTGAALAALEFFGVRGEAVLCPSNTFMATPLAMLAAGARVEFVDCNRDDLCMSFDGLRAQGAERTGRRRPFVVHIGGHIAFDDRADRRALPRRRGSSCSRTAPTRTAPRGTAGGPGTWGDAGVWSFAATKTISTGEGGMLVSRHDDLIEFARAFRNYGKPDYDVGRA